MSYDIDEFITNQIKEFDIEIDEETRDEDVFSLGITLANIQNKSFSAGSPEAKSSLPFLFQNVENSKSNITTNSDDEEEPSRTASYVPALNLTRCSSMPDFEWIDSLLWLASDTYKILSTTDQLIIATQFSEFIQTDDDFHDHFYTKIKPTLSFLPTLHIHTKEDAISFLKGKNTVAIATLVAFSFQYALHFFSLQEKDFFAPLYKSELNYQGKGRTLFMVITSDAKIEPLFQLTTDFFSQEFVWTENTLCQIKTICNTSPKNPKYTLPSEEECSALPQGVSLDTIDDWISTYFSTWLEEEEQEVKDDTKSYPLEELQSLPQYAPMQEKISKSGWYTAKTIGDGTCLVHAFLQCVSSTYRRLPQKSRSLVGQWFRRSVLSPLYIPNELTDEDKKKKFKVEDYKKEVKKYQQIQNVNAWLEQDDLQKFVNVYKINVVVINTSSNDLFFSSPDSGFRGHPYICILCSDEIHFSSIYLANEEKFMLSEEEMLELYPEIVGDRYKDEDYEALRKNIVGVVRETDAENSTKEKIVQNIFKHVRSRTGEPNATPPDKPARALESALSGYAEQLGIQPTVFNQFRQRLQNTTRGGGSPEEDAIAEIQTQLKLAYDTQSDKKFLLKFEAAGTVYSTKIRIYGKLGTSDLPLKIVILSSVCVRPRKNIRLPEQSVFYTQYIYKLPQEDGSYVPNETYDDDGIDLGDDSELSSNSDEIKCFTPVLKSDRSNPDISKRRSQLDILVVLLNKLKLLFPERDKPPQGVDVAFIDNVRMTPFRLLRGELPFYQKYGFFSEGYTKLQEILKRTVWGDVKNEDYYDTKIGSKLYGKTPLDIEKDSLTMNTVIQTLTGQEFPDDMPILDVMKHIPFELENKNNKELLEKFQGRKVKDAGSEWLSDHYLSEKMLKRIALKNGFDKYQLYHGNKSISIYTITLDTESKEWQTWSKTITFLELSPIELNGGRRNKTLKARR